MSLAELPDFEIRLGRSLNDTDAARAQAALDDASVLIRAEARQMQATPVWVDSAGGSVAVPGLAATLCLSVARRFFNNPDNYDGESIGDYSWRGGNAGPELTETEKRLAQSLSVTSRRQLWTLGMSDPDLLIAYATDFVPESTPGADAVPMFDQYDVGGSRFS